MYNKVKITIIGAGSLEFCPATISDIVLSDSLNTLPVEVTLMDIDKVALEVSTAFSEKLIAKSKRAIKLNATTNLEEALIGTDFVISAIERERYHYWSMDFHLPKKYGFRQVYGENGGPGGMFHFLRNIGPVMHIAKTMEKICPNAYLLNYTNPEAKIVEAISNHTSIKAVGICHGFEMGANQISHILNVPRDTLLIVGYGLNHFGFMTEIKDKDTGKDLYPELVKAEKECHWLAEWDDIGLSRIMLRTYGLWPYPGTNHIGEYFTWADEFLASSKIQYFYDPQNEKPWTEERNTPPYIYSFAHNPTSRNLHYKELSREEKYKEIFKAKENEEIKGSHEYGIPIIEAIVFDLNRYIPSLNMVNHGQIEGIIDGMCVEGPCKVDKDGIHLQKAKQLPCALEGMINNQGYIHRLVISAFLEKSKNKLLQAVLFDPTVSTYNNAVALIDDIFAMQADVLPKLEW